MTSLVVQTPGADRRRLLVCLALSVVLHVVGVALIVSRPSSGAGPLSRALNRPDIEQPEREQDPEELNLGIDAAQSVSIDWLGIDTQDPAVGEAIPSMVDQAAQTPVPGEAQVVQSPTPQVTAEPIAQEPVEQSEPLPATPPVEEVAQAQEQPDPAELVEESAQTPSVPEPLETIETPEPSDERESVEITAPVPETDESPVPDPSEPEPIEETQEQPEDAPAEAREQPEAPAAPSSPATPSATSPEMIDETAPLTGLTGILTDREVVATAIKRAIRVDPDRANAPAAGQGLEITTVMPKWSSVVRNTGASANPVVVLQFDARGIVVWADFLRERRVVYSSGSSLVDDQLLNAMYRWRAKGKRLEELNPRDPSSVVEVTIKVLFREERQIDPEVVEEDEPG